MTLNGILNLAWQTVVAPRDVARLLTSLKLEQGVLLLVFALVVVLNTLFFGVSQMVSGQMGAPVALVLSPVVFGTMLAVSVGATIVALTWVGRWLGGKATLQEVAVLVIWLQSMRLMVQAAMILILPISPGLAGLGGIAASFVGLWILSHFMDTAHGFDSLVKAFISVILGIFALALVLTVLLGVLGVSTQGVI